MFSFLIKYSCLQVYNSLSKTVLTYLFNMHSFKHYCHKKISFATAVQATDSGEWSSEGALLVWEHNWSHPTYKGKCDIFYRLAVRKLDLQSQCIIWTPLNSLEYFKIKWIVKFSEMFLYIVHRIKLTDLWLFLCTVLELQNSCETVFISEFITAYIIRIVQRSILEVVLGT